LRKRGALPWLHLLAASVLVIAVIPRLVLGIATALIERHRAARPAANREMRARPRSPGPCSPAMLAKSATPRT
jgi:hypothetical protein